MSSYDLKFIIANLISETDFKFGKFSFLKEEFVSENEEFANVRYSWCLFNKIEAKDEAEAEERWLENINEHLACLSFMCHWYKYSSSDHKILVSGLGHPVRTDILYIRNSGASEFHYKVHDNKHKSYYPLKILKKDLEIMEGKDEFKVLSNLLTEGKWVGLDRKIINALKFYWNALNVDSDQVDLELLNVVIGFESLLKTDNDKTGEIGENLGKKVSVLVGDGDKEKTEIREQIKEIYKLRSSLLHNGKQIKYSDISFDWIGLLGVTIANFLLKYNKEIKCRKDVDKLLLA